MRTRSAGSSYVVPSQGSSFLATNGHLDIIEPAPDFVARRNIHQGVAFRDLQIDRNSANAGDFGDGHTKESAVEVPSDLVTALAFASKGFST